MRGSRRVRGDLHPRSAPAEALSNSRWEVVAVSATDRCEQVMQMIDQTLADYEQATSAAPVPRRQLPPFGTHGYREDPRDPH